MPRIRDQYTDIAVYIYASLADAKNGESFGGSGFLVFVPHETNKDHFSLYAVTNAHVVRKAKTPVIRLNRKDGTTECISTVEEQWTVHQYGDDVAVFPLRIDAEQIQFKTLRPTDFVTPQLIADEDIGIGDETVMVGRFVSHEGKQQNSPAVRFGNIAMMQKEKIVDERGVAQESFLVEIRSLPGYSGSAVLIYSPNSMNDMSERRYGVTRSSVDLFSGKTTMQEIQASIASKGPYLLGIDWCHLNRQSRVREKNGDESSDGYFVNENTGMAGVIPAWKIAEVLNCEKLVNGRLAGSERLLKHSVKTSSDRQDTDAANTN